MEAQGCQERAEKRARTGGEAPVAPAPATPVAPAAAAAEAGAAAGGAAEAPRAETPPKKEQMTKGSEKAGPKVEGTKPRQERPIPPKIGVQAKKEDPSNPSRPRGNATADDPASMEENVRKCAAWIVKYQTETSRRENGVRIRPDRICYKEENRGGVGLSADRCEELSVTILPKFLRDEAEHDAVCVEAMPTTLNAWEWPASVPRENKTSFAPAEECPRMTAKYFFENNAKQIGSDPRMKLAPEGVLEIFFATLGHSHLNQLFKNVVLGARPVEQKLRRYCDQEGRLDARLVAAQHPEIGEVLEAGWKWRVLDWRFPLEVPEGPDVVQFVLNEKNAVAMLPSHWNMAIRMSTYNATQARLGKELVFETLLARMRAEGFSSIASRADVIAIYDWVLQSGGEISSFWGEVKAFGRLFCQSNARKLPPSQYAASARYFEAGLARLGVAYWRAAWFTNPRASGGVVTGLPTRQLAPLYESNDYKPVGVRANQILHRLHEEYVGFWAARGGDGAVRCVEDKAVLDHNVMKFLVAGLCGNAPASKLLADIEVAAIAWDADVRQDFTWESSEAAPVAPAPSEPPDAVCDVGSPSRKEPAKPKMVAQQWGPGGRSLAGAFSAASGTAPGASSAAAEGAGEEEEGEELDWHASLVSDVTQDRVKKAQFWTALNMTGAAYALAPAGEGKGTGDVVATQVGKKLILRAARAFAPGELVLVPLISTVNNLSAKATTPLRIPAPGLTLTGGGASIVPDVVRSYVGTFLPPFWLMERGTATRMANMEMRSVTITMTGLPTVTNETQDVGPRPPKAQASVSAGFVTTLEVPVATNPKAIMANDDLILKAPTLAGGNKAGGKPPKAPTWQMEASKEPAGKAKAEANAAAMKPWER